MRFGHGLFPLRARNTGRSAGDLGSASWDNRVERLQARDASVDLVGVPTVRHAAGRPGRPSSHQNLQAVLGTRGLG